MEIFIEKEPDRIVVVVKNQSIDGDNTILNRLKEGDFLNSAAPFLVIDMSNVEYINSLGITEIINIHRHYVARLGDSFVLILDNVDRKIATILELVELGKITQINLK